MNVQVYGEVHVHMNEEEVAPVGKTSPEMALIKRSVKQRDDNKCQCCGEADKILEVHHIFPQSRYPKMSWDTSNLITLCQSCHRKYHDEFEGVEGAANFAKYMRDKGDYK